MCSEKVSYKHEVAYQLEVNPPSRPLVRQLNRHANIGSLGLTSSLPLDLSVEGDSERVESYVVEMEQERHE
jgi:hypothetical protein